MEKLKINLYEEFADKQVVDALIKDFQEQRNLTFQLIKTQNNLIDKLKIFEDNFNKLNAEVVKIKLRVDLIDKLIQNFLKITLKKKNNQK